MNRIEKHQFMPKQPGFPIPDGVPTTQNREYAKCPKCGRITAIRICYFCKSLMCEECLLEHQVKCLHQPACSRCGATDKPLKFGRCSACLKKTMGENGEEKL